VKKFEKKKSTRGWYRVLEWIHLGWPIIQISIIMFNELTKNVKIISKWTKWQSNWR